MLRNDHKHQTYADHDRVDVHSPARGALTESSDSDLEFEDPTSNRLKRKAEKEREREREREREQEQEQGLKVAADEADSETKKRPRIRKRGASLKKELPIATATRLDIDLVIVQVHGAELDMSGDVGVVGRVKVENEQTAKIDLTGVLYDVVSYSTTGTACVLTIGMDNAKITSFIDSAVAIKSERIDDNYHGDENGDISDANEPVDTPLRGPRSKAKRGRGRVRAKRRK